MADHGTLAEKRFMRRVGGRSMPGSGAMDGAKGDGDLDVSENYRLKIESKSTVNKSMSLKYEYFRKISDEARERGRQPAVVVQFVDAAGYPKRDGSWVAVPEWLFKEVFGG